MRRFLLLLLLLPVAALWAYGCGDQVTQPQVTEPQPASVGPMFSVKGGATSIPEPTNWHRVPGDYATIQEAIDAVEVEPGDGILVGPGEHAGAYITKAVHIRGEEGAIINSPCCSGLALYTGLYMRRLLFGDASGTVIENLVIEGNSSNLWQGIAGWDVDNVTVRQTTIRNMFYGILAISAHNWTMADNVIEETQYEGIALGALELPTFVLSPSGGDHLVLNNTISGASFPFEVAGIRLRTLGFGPDEYLTGIWIQGNKVSFGSEEDTYGVFFEDWAYYAVNQTPNITGNHVVGSNNLRDTQYGVYYAPPELASYNVVSQNISANIHYGQDAHPRHLPH